MCVGESMRARRVDANLSEIVKAYRKLGCRVDVTNDRWDLTVQYAGLTDLIEVKDWKKPPSQRKLTSAEERTHEKMTIRIVMGLDDVADHVAALRTKSLMLMAMPVIPASPNTGPATPARSYSRQRN